MATLTKPQMGVVDADKEALRSKHLGWEYKNKLGNEQRLGLFSQPPPIAVGETNMFPQKTAEKDEDTGKPVSGPRNFYTGSFLKGRIENINKRGSSYFSKGEFLAVGCKYNDPRPGGRGYGVQPMMDVPFKPAKTVTHGKKKPQFGVIWEKGRPAEKRRETRDEDGAVIVEPANIVTGPYSSGKLTQRALMKMTFDGIIRNQIPGKPDDYDIKKKILRKEIEDHHALLQDAPFSSMARSKHKRHLGGLINQPKEWLGEDRVYPPKPERAKTAAVLPEIHDRPFNPTGFKTTNKRVHDFLGPVPKHVPDPPKEKKREPPNEDAPPPFKMTHKRKTVATPSVALNMRNVRAAVSLGPRR